MGRSLIVVDGLEENRRALRDVSKDLQNQLKRSYRHGGDLIAGEARRRVPARSGRLRATIKSAPTLKEGRVKMGTPSRVPYAGWIEFGGTIVHQGPGHRHGVAARKARVRQGFRGGRSTMIVTGSQRRGRRASNVLGASTSRIADRGGAHLIQRPFVKRGRYFWPSASQKLPDVRVFIEEQIERLMRRARLMR